MQHLRALMRECLTVAASMEVAEGTPGSAKRGANPDWGLHQPSGLGQVMWHLKALAFCVLSTHIRIILYLLLVYLLFYIYPPLTFLLMELLGG